MSQASDPTTILEFAAELLGECHQLLKTLKLNSIAEPSLVIGASTELWTSSSTDITGPKTRILGLADRLTTLLQGPHEFLHDYVSSNWEYGALYTVLQFEVLEKIPLEGHAHVSALAKQFALPENKLLRILRLLTCKQVLIEVEEQIFCHTAISEELVKDEKLKAFLGFQLFETRIASAHLADSLQRLPNDYVTGQSAFKHAWGAELYDWHASHPEKGARFNLAMQGVSQSLDPGNTLFNDWFSTYETKDRNLIVEIGGRYGYASTQLAENFSNLSFEIRDSSPTLLERGKKSLPEYLQQRIKFTLRSNNHDLQPIEDSDTVAVYVIRNVFWNWTDEEVIKLLQTFIPVLERSHSPASYGTAPPILINDGISPGRGAFEPHVELAYRRRDLTMMTMHNVKQRTEDEWRELFARASPFFKGDYDDCCYISYFQGPLGVDLGSAQ